jgi:hypothetical protein
MRPDDLAALRGHMAAVAAWRVAAALFAAGGLWAAVRYGLAGVLAAAFMFWLLHNARPAPTAELDKAAGRRPRE